MSSSNFCFTPVDKENILGSIMKDTNTSNTRYDLVQRLTKQVVGMRASATDLPVAKKSKPANDHLPVAYKSKPHNSSQESLMESNNIGNESQNTIRGRDQHSIRKGSQHPLRKESQQSNRKESQHSSEGGSQHSIKTPSVKGSQRALVKPRSIKAPAKASSGLTEIEQRGNFFNIEDKS